MEDYFNCGWYFKTGEFSAPYHGLVLLDNTTGRVSAYRHHIRDAIPFREGIRVTLEHGHANEEVVDISTAAFWYQIEPHGTFEVENNPGLRKTIKRPVPNDVIEGEDLINENDPTLSVQDMSIYGSDWSDNQQLLWKSESSNSIKLEITDLSELAYDIDFFITKGPDYSDFTLSAGSEIVNVTGYAERITPGPSIGISNIPVSGGKIEFKIKAQKIK